MAGLLPAKPTFTIDYPTNLDPSRAPQGKAIMRIQVLEGPCHPRGDSAGLIEVGDGTWTHDLTERFAERVLNLVRNHIPNIPSPIIPHALITPTTFPHFSPNHD